MENYEFRIFSDCSPFQKPVQFSKRVRPICLPVQVPFYLSRHFNIFRYWNILSIISILIPFRVFLNCPGIRTGLGIFNRWSGFKNQNIKIIFFQGCQIWPFFSRVPDLKDKRLLPLDGGGEISNICNFQFFSLFVFHHFSVQVCPQVRGDKGSVGKAWAESKAQGSSTESFSQEVKITRHRIAQFWLEFQNYYIFQLFW